MTQSDPVIRPLQAAPEVLQFMASRRSRPAKTLTLPVPGRDALEEILRIGARSPDHGKLEPWRFIVLERSALTRLGARARSGAEAAGLPAGDIDKAARQFEDSHLCVAVIGVPKESPKAPAIEQALSAGAVCYGVLIAAQASGWGACWLSGWAAHDTAFGREALGLAEGEWVAGFLHLGSEGAVPPERPRPDLSAITSWVHE